MFTHRLHSTQLSHSLDSIFRIEPIHCRSGYLFSIHGCSWKIC
uniref:Uncharacterized protein n=1 Tax=Anguilla anguilla TaxID=7936 RepID=A0A0E9U6C6_ANGAN